MSEDQLKDEIAPDNAGTQETAATSGGADKGHQGQRTSVYTFDATPHDRQTSPGPEAAGAATPASDHPPDSKGKTRRPAGLPDADAARAEAEIAREELAYFLGEDPGGAKIAGIAFSAGFNLPSTEIPPLSTETLLAEFFNGNIRLAQTIIDRLDDGSLTPVDIKKGPRMGLDVRVSLAICKFFEKEFTELETIIDPTKEAALKDLINTQIYQLSYNKIISIEELKERMRKRAKLIAEITHSENEQTTPPPPSTGTMLPPPAKEVASSILPPAAAKPADSAGVAKKTPPPLPTLVAMARETVAKLRASKLPPPNPDKATRPAEAQETLADPEEILKRLSLIDSARNLTGSTLPDNVVIPGTLGELITKFNKGYIGFAKAILIHLKDDPNQITALTTEGFGKAQISLALKIVLTKLLVKKSPSKLEIFIRAILNPNPPLTNSDPFLISPEDLKEVYDKTPLEKKAALAAIIKEFLPELIPATAAGAPASNPNPRAPALSKVGEEEIISRVLLVVNPERDGQPEQITGYPLTGDKVTIGIHPSCDVRLKEGDRLQAELTFADDTITLTAISPVLVKIGHGSGQSLMLVENKSRELEPGDCFELASGQLFRVDPACSVSKKQVSDYLTVQFDDLSQHLLEVVLPAVTTTEMPAKAQVMIERYRGIKAYAKAKGIALKLTDPDPDLDPVEIKIIEVLAAAVEEEKYQVEQTARRLAAAEEEKYQADQAVRRLAAAEEAARAAADAAALDQTAKAFEKAAAQQQERERARQQLPTQAPDEVPPLPKPPVTGIATPPPPPEATNTASGEEAIAEELLARIENTEATGPIEALAYVKRLIDFVSKGYLDRHRWAGLLDQAIDSLKFKIGLHNPLDDHNPIANARVLETLYVLLTDKVIEDFIGRSFRREVVELETVAKNNAANYFNHNRNAQVVIKEPAGILRKLFRSDSINQREQEARDAFSELKDHSQNVADRGAIEVAIYLHAGVVNKTDLTPVAGKTSTLETDQQYLQKIEELFELREQFNALSTGTATNPVELILELRAKCGYKKMADIFTIEELNIINSNNGENIKATDNVGVYLKKLTIALGQDSFREASESPNNDRALGIVERLLAQGGVCGFSESYLVPSNSGYQGADGMATTMEQLRALREAAEAKVELAKLVLSRRTKLLSIGTAAIAAVEAATRLDVASAVNSFIELHQIFFENDKLGEEMRASIGAVPWNEAQDEFRRIVIDRASVAAEAAAKGQNAAAMTKDIKALVAKGFFTLEEIGSSPEALDAGELLEKKFAIRKKHNVFFQKGMAVTASTIDNFAFINEAAKIIKDSNNDLEKEVIAEMLTDILKTRVADCLAAGIKVALSNPNIPVAARPGWQKHLIAVFDDLRAKGLVTGDPAAPEITKDTAAILTALSAL